MHSISKLEAAKGQTSSKHKLDKMKKESMKFAKLNKLTFLSSKKTFIKKDAFKMLKNLSGRSSFPIEMIYQVRLAGSDIEKANLFHLFLHSVYKQSSLSVVPIETQNANIHLCDLIFTVLQTVELSEELPINSNAVADGFPPFLLKYCSVYIVPLVHSLYSSIVLTFK